MSNAKINLVRFMESSKIENQASPVARGVPLGLYYLSDRLQSFDVLVRQLTRAAEIAYGMRDVASLDEISRVLIALPLSQAQAAGRYYQAMIAKRRGEIDRAACELGQLVNQTISPVVQGRALHTLGTVFESQGQVEEAARLYGEAMRASASVDPRTFACAYGQLSAIKSTEGDHRAALSDLQSIWPIAMAAAQQHPHLYFQFHNEIAVELAAVGKLQEAREHSRIAISSPLAPAYPEWQATHTELEELLHRPVQVVVAIPDPEPETKPVRVALVTTGDIRSQNVAAQPLTRTSLQPLVLVKPFVISHPARAPPLARP
jgi:hypothetical protein